MTRNVRNYDSDSEECTEIYNTEKFSEHFHFIGSSGSSSEEEIFPQPEPVFFDDETNLYTVQQVNKKEQEGPLKRSLYLHSGKPVILQELKVFCAVVVLMSVLCKLSVRDYWTKRPTVQAASVESVDMSWDRFLTILAMLQVSNSNT
jgi:hypothetical protein